MSGEAASLAKAKEAVDWIVTQIEVTYTECHKFVIATWWPDKVQGIQHQ